MNDYLYSDTCMEGTTHLHWWGLAPPFCTPDFLFIFFHFLLHSPIHKAPGANVCYYPLVVNVAKLKVLLLNTAGVGGPDLRLQTGFAAILLGSTPKMHFSDRIEACKHVNKSITHTWVLLACRGRLSRVKLQVITLNLKQATELSLLTSVAPQRMEPLWVASSKFFWVFSVDFLGVCTTDPYGCI